MRIEFAKLKTSTGTIQVDFGDGYQTYNVSDVKDNGITIPETCTDYSSIKIKGSSKVLSDLDVIKNVGINTSNDYIKIKTIQIEEYSRGCGGYEYNVIASDSEISDVLNQLFVRLNDDSYKTLEELNGYSGTSHIALNDTSVFYKIARRVTYIDGSSGGTYHRDEYEYTQAPQYRIQYI